MAVWVIRGGECGQHEEMNLAEDRAFIGYNEVGDLTAVESRKEVASVMADSLLGEPQIVFDHHVGTVWRFAKVIKVGDLVVLPLKGQRFFVVGTITGVYEYRPERSQDEGNHARPVLWKKGKNHIDVLSAELQKSLKNCQHTVFQPRVADAEHQIRAIINGSNLGG